MDQILSQIERIADLSDDELAALKDSIVKEFKGMEKAENSSEVVDAINQLADAADAVNAERESRKAHAEELSTAREAASARIMAGEEAEAAETPEAEAAVEDDTDQETDKKRKKDDEDEESEVVPPVTEASVNDSVESTLSTESNEVAELAVEQPAVQPAEVADGIENPEVGQTDKEIHEKSDALVDVPGEDKPAVEAAKAEAADEDAAEDAESDAADEVEAEATDAEVESEDDESDDDENKEEDSEETVTAAANNQELEAPADRRPNLQSEPTSVPVTITAAAGVPGVAAGSELSNLGDVADAIVKRLLKMGPTNPAADGEQLPVASFTTTYPEDRRLGADKGANSEKVQAVVNPSAITAAGGLCAPVEVRYDVFSFNEETGRPVRDALAVFSADRGGIRFVTPPTLSDLEGAVSLWTLADDESATDGSPTKPSLRVECGTEVVVYTDAIPLILTFGNMGARAYPELVARHTELGMVWHARYAETRLLTRIGALSTNVSAAAELGAARDFLVQLDQVAAGYRNRHRLSGTSPLRVLLPEWFRNALRADLVKQLPGDGMDTTFNLADAQINSFFAARNINASFFLDGETGQIMGNQNAGAINAFPSTMVWYLFSEGTFLFLDGGTLDLGLVRDSQLNSTNDYQLFLETFEGVAKIGIESLRVSSAVKIKGASSATVTVAG